MTESSVRIRMSRLLDRMASQKPAISSSASASFEAIGAPDALPLVMTSTSGILSCQTSS